MTIDFDENDMFAENPDALLDDEVEDETEDDELVDDILFDDEEDDLI